MSGVDISVSTTVISRFSLLHFPPNSTPASYVSIYVKASYKDTSQYFAEFSLILRICLACSQMPAIVRCCWSVAGLVQDAGCSLENYFTYKHGHFNVTGPKNDVTPLIVVSVHFSNVILYSGNYSASHFRWCEQCFVRIERKGDSFFF